MAKTIPMKDLIEYHNEGQRRGIILQLEHARQMELTRRQSMAQASRFDTLFGYARFDRPPTVPSKSPVENKVKCKYCGTYGDTPHCNSCGAPLELGEL